MRTSLCLLLTALTASAQQRQPGRGVNFYRLEKEAGIGAVFAKDVRQRTTPIDSAAVRAYVEKIGRLLATQLPNIRFTYTFDAITDDLGGPTHEPLSFPGGYIFVSADLIRTAQTEGEFAGMLAHAMAHAAERHATRQATRAELANTASIPLIYMSGSAGMGAGVDQVVPIAMRRMQRQFENEADVLAVQMMSGAGFDPKALVSYITRVQLSDRSRMGSPLPARDERIASMEKAIQELPQRAYVSGDEFHLIQDAVQP